MRLIMQGTHELSAATNDASGYLFLFLLYTTAFKSSVTRHKSYHLNKKSHEKFIHFIDSPVNG